MFLIKLSDVYHEHHALDAADLSKGTLFEQWHRFKGVNSNMDINVKGSQAVWAISAF